MPIFEYKGTDKDGQAVSGTVVGASLAAVSADLDAKGYVVEHLGLTANTHDPIPQDFNRERPRTEEVPQKDITRERSYVETHVIGQVIGRVPLSTLLIFFRTFNTMLKAAVPPVQALDTIGGQQSDPRMKGIVREIRQHVLEGRPFSFGMQRHPEVFSPIMVSLVRTGEESGNLDDTLALIADYIDREIKLRNLMRKLTLYPKIVLFASVAIITAANWIIGMFNGKPLYSPLTEASTWFCLVPMIVGFWVFVRFLIPNPRFKVAWDQFVAGLPYIGRTVRQLAMAKFGRALGALYKGGVPLHRATLLAADACGNEYIRSRIYPVARHLEEGQGVADTYAMSGVVDPMVLDMIRTGETTGNLDQMVTKVADFYEDDAEVRSTVAANILGLVVFLCVAIYIGFIVISFWSGYFGGLTDAMR